MDTVNVVVIHAIGEERLQQIRNVSPAVRVHDALGLYKSENHDRAAKERLDALLEQAEVIFGSAPPQNLITRAPMLKWIQTPLAGVDRFLIPEIIKSPVILTNSRGIHRTQVSELVFEMLLMLAKKAPFFFEMKRERKWQRTVPGILHSKTLGILGLGSIGQEVARLGKAFGMAVLALESEKIERAPNVDEIFPPQHLSELLSRSDYVVITLPLTSGTRKLMGEAEFRAMKPTAYLVNVARGAIVDEEALIRALSQNWIAGAGLDVFATEPLPAESKLWEFPNVIISPHVAGEREDYNALATDLFCQNLKRYLAGETLLNIIDKKEGF